MDNYLSNEFGNLGLSSTAREWMPPGEQQQQQQQQSRPYQQHNQPPPSLPEKRHPQQSSQYVVQSNSNEWQQQQVEKELNHFVKEFVPGRGWSTQESAASDAVTEGEIVPKNYNPKMFDVER